MAPCTPVNLLVDFYLLGEIRNMKEDERRLERTVFLLRYLFISKTWLIDFQGTTIFMALAVRRARTFCGVHEDA